MRVMVVHNFYQQAGGEDSVVRDEIRLLESFGHDVRTFFRHNDAIEGMSQLSMLKATMWNRRIAHELRAAVREHGSDIVHFHNTFPLMSPACFYAARAAGAAVVQTLHNYRMGCVNGFLYRDGKPCVTCVGRSIKAAGVWRGCYRDSRAASAAVALMMAGHRVLGTWRRRIDAYIAVSPFSRDILLREGIPRGRMHVKPNFVAADPGIGAGRPGEVVFVGRLSPEKGIAPLLEATRRSRAPWRLKVIGTGPMLEDVQRAAAADPRVTAMGFMNLDDIYGQLQRAAALMFTSVGYETFGRTIIEAYACGTPVIASDHGPMQDLVVEGVTGHRFTPGDPDAIAAMLNFVASKPDHFAAMRPAARRTFDDHFTAGRNHEQLLHIYRAAMLARRRPQRSSVWDDAGASLERGL